MRPLVPLAVVPVAAIMLTACGGGRPSGGDRDRVAATTPRPTKHNFQDVIFGQGMIPHHQQAVDVSTIAIKRTATPQVKQLATAIKTSRAPEIQSMTGWLNNWGATVPASDPDGSGHDLADMGDIGNGMMSRADVAKLTRLSGAAFDRAFLTLMVKHHQGALISARAEQSQGAAAEAKTLAGDLVASYTAEITRMRVLLRRA